MIDKEEKKDYIKAIHNGYYKKFGIFHTREWILKNEKIIIKDSLNKKSKAIFRLHFHPSISKEEIKKTVKSNYEMNIVTDLIAFEYNKRSKNKCSK